MRQSKNRGVKSYLSIATIMVLTLSVGVEAKPITEQDAKNVALNWVQSFISDTSKIKKMNFNKVENTEISSNEVLEPAPNVKHDIKDIIGNIKSFEVKEVIDDTILLGKIKKSSSFMDKNPLQGSSYIKLIKLKPQGWVLISADDMEKPIIGFSLKSKFDENNLPIQLEEMLVEFAKKIDKKRAKGKLKVSANIQNEWKRLRKNSDEFKEYLNSKDRTMMEKYSSSDNYPMPNSALITTATWSQGKFYNRLTPADSNGPDNHTLVGCTATAMGIVMKANSWPDVGEGSHGYTPSGYPYQFVNFGSTNYNWANMPLNSLTNYNNSVATILYHAGVSVDMHYGATSSGAWPTPGSFENHFRYYTYGQYFHKDNFQQREWEDMIFADLGQGHPILYGNHQHSFVMDGFYTYSNGTTVFHINYGWNGSSNGYYYLNNLQGGYNTHQRAMFGLKPDNSNFLDRYEGDNWYNVSSTMSKGGQFSRQNSHSINPKTDSDWINIYIPSQQSVTIETLNSNGDTVMNLYAASNGHLVASDDDGGSGYLSKITKTLAAGTYYIRVQSYNQNTVIPSYDIRIR